MNNDFEKEYQAMSNWGKAKVNISAILFLMAVTAIIWAPLLALAIELILDPPNAHHHCKH